MKTLLKALTKGASSFLAGFNLTYVWIALIVALAAAYGYLYVQVFTTRTEVAEARADTATAKADLQVSKANSEHLGAALDNQSAAITAAAENARKGAEASHRRSAAVLNKPLSQSTSAGEEVMNAWIASKQ